MDSHARSLLDRLNYGSPKPPKTPTAPETKVAEAVSLSTPENKESQFQSGSQSPSPPPEKRGLPATLQTEASIKLNDMLMTARQRSRQTSSASPSNSASLNGGASEANSSDTVIPPLAPSTRAVNPLTEKDEQQNVVNTSDGDSSAVAEEMLTTPAGSNISSIVSNGTDNSMKASTPASDDIPQGVRIVNDVPSIVSLAASKSEIPRLQITTDASGRATFVGEGIEHIANLSRSFGAYDRHIIGATSKYIVYALKDGRIRIIDQNTGTRAIAETPSASAVISLNIQDDPHSEESFLLALDAAHELTIWSIKPWKIDSADIALDWLVRIQTAGQKVDPSFPPIAKWWPRYSNCLAVCVGLAVSIYVLHDAETGQTIDISGGNNYAVSIPVRTGVRDFAFSVDGSALAVLDYHGDILLWALRSDSSFCEFYDTSRLQTKLTMNHQPTLKMALSKDLNPCSIQFLELGDDDSTPAFTSLLLVGSSYNRHLHLIDIGQGSILQEIVLPSITFETMPVQNFSMSYTREKRFLTIGDTLSNSIFFIHLSAEDNQDERIASQSEYIVKVAEQKRDSTSAAFDYVTEVPFIANNRLQALAVTPSSDALLDVFTAHSTGFTMLSPNQDDILPGNYKTAKHATSKPIQNPMLDCTTEPGSQKNSCPSSKSQSRRSSVENIRAVRSRTASPKQDVTEVLAPPIVLETKLLSTATTTDGGEGTGIVVKSPTATPKQQVPSRSPSPVAPLKSPTEPELEVSSLAKDLESLLNNAFEQQYQRLANEQKQLAGLADDRHESILKVVSSTLTTNVGKLLEQTVHQSVEKAILPHLTTMFKKSVDQQLTKNLSASLDKTLPKELRPAVNDAIHKALLENHGGAKFSDQLSKAISSKLETTLQKDLITKLIAAVEKSLVPLVNNLNSSFDKHFQKLQNEHHTFRRETNKKLDALAQAVSKLNEHLASNAGRPISPSSSPTISSPKPSPRKQMMQAEFERGNYATGIEIWSDSPETELSELFEVCLKYSPSILNPLEQLSLMSVANAITVDFKTHLEQRLDWLEKAVSLARREGRYQNYWPRVLEMIDQRLEVVYDELSEKDRKSTASRKVAVAQYNVQSKLKTMKL